MKITFNEWKIILHALTVAQREYEKQRDESKEGSDFHRIFNEQASELDMIIQKIENSEI